MATAGISVSEALADWIATSRDGLPASSLEKSADIIVDIVGLCIGARNQDYVAAAMKTAEPGDHVIIGQGRGSASSAALVNGIAAHGEDFDDTFEGGPIHSGVVVVPAMLAAAQTYELSTADIVIGTSVGSELCCRLALTLPKAVHKAGFHPTAVLGIFGAVAGICAARQCDRGVTANALGIAGSMASGIIEYLGDGSWTKRMHPGWSAQSALKAVALAEAGFVGPRWVFEGAHGVFKSFAPSITPRTDALFADIGKMYVMETITFKSYPCGTMVQPYIDCAVELRKRGVATKGISRILCKTAEGIVHRLWEPIDQKQEPPTPYAAKFSVPYGVALGLLHGDASLKDFSEDALKDQKIRSLSSLVNYEIDPDNPYPETYCGHVRIEYEGGQVEESERDHMRGGVKEPLTQAEIDSKFRANVAFGGRSDGRRLLDICRTIGRGEGKLDLLDELA